MKGTVLIVDDSLTVRMELAQAFEAEGFGVLPCGTGAEARALAAQGVVSAAIRRKFEDEHRRVRTSC